MMTSIPARPPVVVLGGDTNALSVARSLATMGVPVYTLGAERYVAFSRHARALPLPKDGDPADAMLRFLLGREAAWLHGAVLLAASDVGIGVLARHREELLESYRLDNSDCQPQLALLDKLSTYQTAVEAGVPTPRFWRADNAADVDRIRDELTFPLIVKPLLSHEYKARFPGTSKFRLATGQDDLTEAYRDLTGAGLAVMLVEKIPGPDDRLCSYYTYLDEAGEPTCHFTKRIIRRNPPNEGIGCYHVTDWNPEVRDVALRLFRYAGLRGVATAEFIRDDRDGRLKLIECTARFTSAICLVTAAGVDLPRHAYLRIIGEPHTPPASYRTGLRLLYPSDDLRSFLALRRSAGMDFATWARSLRFRQTFPVLRMDDPVPAVARGAFRMAGRARRMGTTDRPTPGRVRDSA